MLPVETFRAIQESGSANIIKIDDKEYTDRPVYLQPKRNDMEPLYIETLQGVVDYVNDISDIDVGGSVFIKIHSPSLVEVYGYADADGQRNKLVECRYRERNDFSFGSYYEPETFNIALRTSFEPTPVRDEVLKFVSGLTADSSVKLADDGVSQQTVVKTGVQGLDRARVPQDIILYPFRTFPEIEQPLSHYIIRLRRRDDNVPQVALFTADNELWRPIAIQSIKGFLAEKVTVPIIA